MKKEKIKRFMDFWEDDGLDEAISGMFGVTSEKTKKIIEMLDYLAEEIEKLKNKKVGKVN